MEKALFPGNRWLYVYQGYEVAEDLTTIKLSSYEQKRDFSIYDTDRLKISVSAVVGRNGSGKSSFVELLIRSINNLTAALLGEKFNFAKAEHLHYIDDLYIDLLIQIENKFIIVSVRDRDLKILPYFISSEDRLVFNLDKNKIEHILKQGEDNNSSVNILKRHPKGRSILRSLFYSLVFNYSLYGFNYRDFFQEETPASRLKQLKIIAYNNMEDEQTCWLGGIFHKNDGYQTPIVLHPLRENGQLNIAKENRLAKERMLCMLFYKDAKDNYPGRIINERLEIVGLRTSLASKKYSRENMLDYLGIKKTQNIALNFEDIYNIVLLFWSENFDIKRGARRPYYQEACGYLVYKTLKIIHSYKKYNSVFRYLSRSNSDKKELYDKLRPILFDYTHITKKLRQTINYLIDPLFNPHSDIIQLDVFENIKLLPDTKEATRKFLSCNPTLHLPPPIFKTDLILFKLMDGIKGEDLPYLNIPFSGLSSGERQVAYTISNILYHLTNIDSEWDDKFRDSGRLTVIKYKYVNIMLDEIELYFHPEMQRKFLFLLVNSIQCVNFQHIKGINILFVTHSPFILSDIPSNNVLALGERTDADNPEPIKTFGANIMEMLNDTLFMDSSIGESVKREIECLVKYHIDIVRNKKLSSQLKKLFKKDSQRLDYLCKNLSDELWKSSCQRMLDEIKFELNKKVENLPFAPPLF